MSSRAARRRLVYTLATLDAPVVLTRDVVREPEVVVLDEDDGELDIVPPARPARAPWLDVEGE